MAMYTASPQYPKQNKSTAKLNIKTFEADKNMLFIYDLLSGREQVELVDAILKAENQCKNMKLINKNPNSNTIMVINPKNTYQSKHRSSPIFHLLFQKTLKQISDSKIKTNLPGIRQINTLKMDRIKALEYDVVDGKIEAHCDCRKGYVMIFSVGLTANFNVKSPKMQSTNKFECRNGDCLVFDTSKEADIVHEISSIKPNSYHSSLATKYPRFRRSRICVMLGYSLC
eukprot:527600_1